MLSSMKSSTVLCYNINKTYLLTYVKGDSLSRTLAFGCGHGYVQEEYAMHEERVTVAMVGPYANNLSTFISMPTPYHSTNE